MRMDDDVRGLDRSEHLVLFGFRLTALGHGDCPALRGLFCGALGADADEGLCSLLTFVRMLGWGGRRRVRLHVPGCAAMSPDERAVLDVVAAAQASLFAGDDADLRTRLAGLLDAAPDEPCVMAAQALASTLTCHGVDLPPRAVGAAAAAPPSKATLH